MNKLFLVITLIFGVFISILAYNVGHEQGKISCVNSADILHSDTNDIMSVYISGDIAHIYFAYNAIYFENGGDPLEFETKDAMYDYVSEITAYNSCTIGYKDDLDYNIRNGYIYARTVYNEDEQYTDLIFDGPNWTVDADRDTSYLISTFNKVDKVYDTNTKFRWYESYAID